MTLTINDTTMTSDQSAHTARQAPGRPALLYEMTNERGRLDCHPVPGLRPPTLRRCRVRAPGLTFSG